MTKKKKEVEKESLKKQVKKVNQILKDGEPANITVMEYGKRKYTGYQVQHVVDAMNEVFGPDGWTFHVMANELSDNGKEYIAQVKAVIDGNTKRAYGGSNTVDSHADAKKGAQSDALKKALSYFGVGSAAFRGDLATDGASEKSTFKRANKMIGRARNVMKLERWKENISESDLYTDDQKDFLKKKIKKRIEKVNNDTSGASDSDFKCGECKDPITKAEKEYSLKNFDKALCRECQDKERNKNES